MVLHVFSKQKIVILKILVIAITYTIGTLYGNRYEMNCVWGQWRGVLHNCQMTNVIQFCNFPLLLGATLAEWLRCKSSNPWCLTSEGSTPDRLHSCEEVVFLAVGLYWLARCQYNVTELCVMINCDIVHQCASTLKVVISPH